jgi:hypothetical protein
MSPTLALITKGVVNNPAEFANLYSLVGSLDSLIWADMACTGMAHFIRGLLSYSSTFSTR